MMEFLKKFVLKSMKYFWTYSLKAFLKESSDFLKNTWSISPLKVFRINLRKNYWRKPRQKHWWKHWKNFRKKKVQHSREQILKKIWEMYSVPEYMIDFLKGIFSRDFGNNQQIFQKKSLKKINEISRRIPKILPESFLK